MCFHISRHYPKMQTAKEDIVVYKAINKSGTGWVYNMRDKEGNIMKWIPGWVYYQDMPKSHLFTKYIRTEIEGNCFHSNKTIRLAKGKKDSYDMVVKMIIPKGALYYENEEEYVSNELYYPKQRTKKITKKITPARLKR